MLRIAGLDAGGSGRLHDAFISDVLSFPGENRFIDVNSNLALFSSSLFRLVSFSPNTFSFSVGDLGAGWR